MTIKVGLDSTKIVLTEVGKEWFTEQYQKGFVYEYDENGEFRLNAMTVVEKQAIAEIICPMGIPYTIPAAIDGLTTFKMANQEEPEECPHDIPALLRGKANVCLAGGPKTEDYPGGQFCSHLETVGKCKLDIEEAEG